MKKRILIFTIALALLASPVLALDDVFFRLGTLFHKTTLVPVTDTNALFITSYNSAGGTIVSDWTKIKGAFITCETFDVRISYGVAAEKDATPVGHVLAAGQSAFITDPSWLQSMYVINKTALSLGFLMVTLVY